MKIETREVILLLCRGLLVKDYEASSNVNNSGEGTCMHNITAPRPGAVGAEVSQPCLNAGNKVPCPCVNTDTGGAKGSQPDTAMLIQSAV